MREVKDINWSKKVHPFEHTQGANILNSKSYIWQKLWAYLGILLMFVMNFGPFFSYFVNI